jgi:hypothetical protein
VTGDAGVQDGDVNIQVATIAVDSRGGVLLAVNAVDAGG